MKKRHCFFDLIKGENIVEVYKENIGSVRPSTAKVSYLKLESAKRETKRSLIHTNDNSKTLKNHIFPIFSSQCFRLNYYKIALEIYLQLNCVTKVARTIADLENATHISEGHISEAIQYRSLDREGWLG